MILSDWIVAVLGKTIKAPGAWGGQCVDAADDYIRRVYGLQPVRLNAIDWYRKPAPGFTVVPNNPTNYPPPGALVVWGVNPRAGTGQYGHIAVAVAANRDVLVSVDQNWAGVKKCAIVEHSYDGVLGWLLRQK